MNIYPTIHPMIHVVEQGGIYHSIGEQGQRVCESNADLGIFSDNLSIRVFNVLSCSNEGAQVEVLFRKDGETVRFIVRNGERGSCFTEMISEIPQQGEVKTFLDYFLKKQKERILPGNKISMTVKCTGQYVNFFDGNDGIGSNAQYEIMKIEGGSLPALVYEQAPLPDYVPRPFVGKRQRIHKVGNVIGEDAVEELEYLGVEIVRIK